MLGEVILHGAKEKTQGSLSGVKNIICIEQAGKEWSRCTWHTGYVNTIDKHCCETIRENNPQLTVKEAVDVFNHVIQVKLSFFYYHLIRGNVYNWYMLLQCIFLLHLKSVGFIRNLALNPNEEHLVKEAKSTITSLVCKIYGILQKNAD